jgi:hypothetical protein
LVPRRVPSFDAVVALVTCARLLTPSLPLIPIPSHFTNNYRTLYP